MYTFEPKKTNNTANVLIGALIFCAALLFLFPALLPELAYRGIIQSLGLACIIAALALMSRYSLKRFTYKVHENGERMLDLDVIETQGKRCYTVCRVALGNIESVERATTENRESLKKRCAGRKKFSYLPDLAPTDSIYVFVTECGEPLALILAYDETLLNILTANRD